MKRLATWRERVEQRATWRQRVVEQRATSRERVEFITPLAKAGRLAPSVYAAFAHIAPSLPVVAPCLPSPDRHR
jgi:hypothetical protein